jgi:DegV family protein with EDD domain
VIKIVTDSTCDLPPVWLKQFNITVVPFNILFGLDSFREGLDISPELFYERIQSEQTLPTTAQPAVGILKQTYQQLTADGSQVVSIHLTSKLSGAWQAARLAASQLNEDCGVYVVDSLTGSVGLGLMVREATQLAQAGMPAANIVRKLESDRAQINVFILLKDLRYARMSGRVGALRHTLASLLNVKPIVGVADGALIPLDRVRGERKGISRMLDLAEAATGDSPVHMGLTHAIARTQAENLLPQLQSRLNCRDSFMADLSLSLAVHFGPGTIGFATYPAN